MLLGAENKHVPIWHSSSSCLMKGHVFCELFHSFFMKQDV